MKEREWYRGYMRINNFNEYLQRVGDEFKFMAYADHLYVKEIMQEAYDKDGNSLGEVSREEYYSRRETKEVDQQLKLIQMDYDFYLMPLGYVSTQDEVQRATRVLNSSGLGSFDSEYDHFDLFNRYDDFSKVRDSDSLFWGYQRPFEVSCLGYSLWIKRKSYKAFLNFDITKYKSNLERFIKENGEDWGEIATHLFNTNISVLSAFYLTKKSTIKRRGFRYADHAIKRLNFNITQKERQRL